MERHCILCSASLINGCESEKADGGGISICHIDQCSYVSTCTFVDNHACEYGAGFEAYNISLSQCLFPLSPLSTDSFFINNSGKRGGEVHPCKPIAPRDIAPNRL